MGFFDGVSLGSSNGSNFPKVYDLPKDLFKNISYGTDNTPIFSRSDKTKKTGNTDSVTINSKEPKKAAEKPAPNKVAHKGNEEGITPEERKMNKYRNRLSKDQKTQIAYLENQVREKQNRLDNLQSIMGYYDDTARTNLINEIVSLKDQIRTLILSGRKSNEALAEQQEESKHNILGAMNSIFGC